MISKIIRLQSRIYWAGILLLLISLLILSITPHEQSSDNGYFLLNFILTVSYFSMLLFHKKSLVPATRIFHWMIFFVLLLISAWALNMDITVFESSVPWLTVIQIVVCSMLVLSAFFRFLPAFVNHLSVFIIGFGLPVFVYLSFYVFPLYFLSLLAAIGLGISLHSFAPLLLTAAIVFISIKMIRYRKAYLYSFLTGIGISILITTAFCVAWTSAVNNINKEYRHAVANHDPDIPLWMQLAQRIPQTEFTKKILKSGIVYVQADIERLNVFWDSPSTNFNEIKKHDPLINFASLFARLDIGNDDKIKILESSFNSRHETQERMWSGNHLVTQNVSTHTQLWPALQLAYTEKTITVKNTNPEGRWPQSEEAIYTFYLPEGSAVSSLSLWINGIEEKGILTTKEKAVEAYKTIVQTERRDPSVVHWQEGNTITARVFPVMAGSNRVFKIGITSPLVKKDKAVFFQNAWFQGPPFESASEIIQLNLNSSADDISIPGFFTKKSALNYAYEGSYKNDWQVHFASPEIKADAFVFDGNSYSIAPYQRHEQSKIFQNYFLDINRSWTRQEFDQVINVLKGKNVFVNSNGIIKLDSTNANQLFEKLHEANFSLFPLYDIEDPETSLLITKSGAGSPNVSDLHDTPFASKLNLFAGSRRKLYALNIGDNLAPYLKTLQEYRAILCEKGSIDILQRETNENTFSADQETDNLIVLKDAGITIQKSEPGKETKSEAPDHVFRLFAYNNIMRQVKQAANEAPDSGANIVKEAELAHIVSPVSSLIVLESQRDYDRFNIQDSKDGLKNASHKMAGSVPEPHEWVLIFLSIGLFLYLTYSSRQKKKMC